MDPSLGQGSSLGNLQAIRTSSDHLLSLVNSVLDLSSMENGKLPLHRSRFAPRQALEELATTLGPLAGSKGLDVRLRIAGQLPPAVEGDRLRWLQILLNLASNGIRYTERGYLEIEASWDAPRQVLAIRVSDSGPGIPPEKLSLIFEPYSRIEESNPTQAHGTGLGLAISKQLAETMDGALSVRSTIGTGTTFQYRQPFDAVAEESAGQVAPGDEALTACLMGKRVLLCEDTPMNVRLAVQVLQRLGADHAVAQDGRQALAMLEQGGWDLVLMDLHMPFHDGYEVTRLVRDPASAIPCKRVPILALTADASEEARAKAMDAGMDDLLAKPYRLADLARHATALIAT